MEVNFVKLKDVSVREAPVIEMEIDGKVFNARIDTGADLSVIPRTCINSFRRAADITVRAYNGRCERVPVYKGEVVVAGKSIYLDKILAATDDVGSIGLDVLEHFSVLLESGKLSMEPI